jgi:FkbM family methyltransferase
VAGLVFDIGMHNGDDTAHYLAGGYDVVAVDANPALCEAAAERFAAAIEDGRLTIRNVGIDNRSAAELTFWVSDQSEWSSFSREWATKKGASAAPIRVPVVRFADLLNDYAQALFVKIDIEGNDVDRVRELHECKFPPAYLSFAPGSSGPMPGELPGPWMTAAELLTVMNRRRALDHRLDDRGPTEWFDIHARHSRAGPGLA